MIEKTFAIIKPDRRFADPTQLFNAVKPYLNQAGLTILTTQLIHATQQQAEAHFQHLQGRNGSNEIFDRNVKYFTNAHLLVLQIQGEDAIATLRRIIGPTDPSNAPKGTIRGDLSSDSLAAAVQEGRGLENVIHASESKEDRDREERIWLVSPLK